MNTLIVLRPEISMACFTRTPLGSCWAKRCAEDHEPADPIFGDRRRAVLGTQRECPPQNGKMAVNGCIAELLATLLLNVSIHQRRAELPYLKPTAGELEVLLAINAHVIPGCAFLAVVVGFYKLEELADGGRLGLVLGLE
jgi:hypothetical protein